jgi:MoaA/NifB/PqqE/SkfB family radical SAM enzyme
MRQTVAFAKETANVFFHILTQCNLNCSHCYINPKQHGSERLALKQIESWLDVLVRRAPTANLILLGGEPTLHPELAAVVKAARCLGFGSVTIDTNGYLFHNILDRVTPEEVDFFSFSLDGPVAAVNDAIRGDGSFAACTRGIRQAKARGFAASLIYTVSSRNLSHLKDVPPLLKEWGIDHFFIQVIGLRGNSAVSSPQSTPLQVTRQEWMQTVPPVADVVAAQGIRVTYPKVYLSPQDPFECAGRVADNYFVFPNGRVYRCPLCEDFPLHSLEFDNDRLSARPPVNEENLFQLEIAEGCVMNKLIQPGNIDYRKDGTPAYKIACCLLKEQIDPKNRF